MSHAPQTCDERAIAAIAQWAPVIGDGASLLPLLPAVLMPMHMAIDSSVYGVTRSDDAVSRFFLKVYQLDMPAGVDFASTVAASKQAAALGVSPALVAEDAGNQALLYALLPASEWRMAMRNDFAQPGFTAAVLSAKRAWHCSALLPESLTPFQRIAGYLQHMEVLAAPQPDVSLTLRMPQGLHTLVAWMSRIEQGLRAAGCDSGPVHGENTVSNVMVGPGGAIRLVDFDRAVNADPHYDLGATCNEMCSFDDEVADVVELYLGSHDARIAARAQLYMIVDDVLWGCWSLIAHYVSARSTSVEFYKYAQGRFLRARYGLERWDIDALLRRA